MKRQNKEQRELSAVYFLQKTAKKNKKTSRNSGFC
jgi:hypothetical protein